MVVARLARRAGLGSPSVRTNDAARGAVLRAALGVPSPPAAVLFAGPAVLGDILADSRASAELQREEILTQMERRGFGFPPTPGQAFAIEPVPGLSAPFLADYEKRARALNGGPASDDTFAYDVATTVALESVDAAASSGKPSRTAVLRSLRTRTFEALGNRLRFTRAGAATRACYEFRALDSSAALASIACATLPTS